MCVCMHVCMYVCVQRERGGVHISLLHINPWCCLMFRAGELPPYEVICLWIADMLLLLDNTALVLKHWSINEPLMVS